MAALSIHFLSWYLYNNRIISISWLSIEAVNAYATLQVVIPCLLNQYILFLLMYFASISLNCDGRIPRNGNHMMVFANDSCA